METPGSVKAAGWLSLLAGVGFGLPCAWGIGHLARTGEVWVFFSFPTYGAGPFERFGIDTTVPLLLGFLTVCAAEIALAAALWRRTPFAARWSLALLPIELAFWIGFALPFGPILGIGRALLAPRSPRSAPSRPLACRLRTSRCGRNALRSPLRRAGVLRSRS